jgi:hypothetical protein
MNRTDPDRHALEARMSLLRDCLASASGAGLTQEFFDSCAMQALDLLEDAGPHAAEMQRQIEAMFAQRGIEASRLLAHAAEPGSRD